MHCMGHRSIIHKALLWFEVSFENFLPQKKHNFGIFNITNQTFTPSPNYHSRFEMKILDKHYPLLCLFEVKMCKNIQVSLS
jgi:hypothetical protein